ncbi:MAG: glutathione peroxidase [Bacteroidales bacterium]|nr:glutathione peroxidase [Bacteroidales bacterium]
MANFYELKAQTSKGKEYDFSQLEGKVVLIANTASKCGFTPQYKDLEELNLKYKDKGLVVLGFPCNQFGGQEPGSNEQISEFCQLNYGVTFQIMAKSDVNGAEANEVFKFLKSKAPFVNKSLKMKAISALSKTATEKDDIRWNFTKFLVGRDGEVIGRFEPVDKAEDLEKAIVAAL